MAEPIKVQILQRLLANLTAQVNNNAATARPRAVTLTFDLVVAPVQLPGWQLYHLDERELPDQKHTRGRTFEFPIVIKVSLSAARDPALEIERHVAEVQRIMESDLQLGGLANIVDEGSVELSVTEGAAPVASAFLKFTVQYRRSLGDPYATY